MTKDKKKKERERERERKLGVPAMVEWKQIQLVSMRMWVRSLALPRGLGSSDAMSCGVGSRHGLDPALLWLWCKLAAAALI